MNEDGGFTNVQEALRSFKKPLWKEYGIILLLVILFIGLVIYRYKYRLPSMPDFFRAYYPAGRLIIENPKAVYELSDTVVYGFVNLPILAYLFTPFAYLRETHAGILFTLLSILATFWFTFILVRFTHLGGWKQTFFLGVILLNVPVSNSIWLGNTTHFIFLLVIGSFFCLRSRQKMLSGVFLAISGLIKLPLLFLMLFFAIKGHWRALFGFCSTLLGITALSIIFFGLNLNLTWFDCCILAFSGKVVGAYNVQSIDSFLIRLLAAIPLDRWDMYEASWQLKLFRYALFLFFIGGTFWTLYKTRNSTIPEAEGIEFSIFLCLALILSPISWTHYYMLLLLPISLLIKLQWITLKKWTWSAAIAVAILLISTPPVKSVSFSNSFLGAFVRNFCVSHYFWGGVLLLGILLAARWQIKPVTLAPTVYTDNVEV